MKFDRFLYLKGRLLEELEAGGTVSENMELADSLSLAYIGDVCYSLYWRNEVIKTGIEKVRVLHSFVAEIVSAKVQSVVYRAVKEQLSETEQMVAKRARNANVHVPKSATVAEYRESTALEAVIGYLYISGQEERLNFLLRQCRTAVLDYMKAQEK